MHCTGYSKMHESLSLPFALHWSHVHMTCSRAHQPQACACRTRPSPHNPCNCPCEVSSHPRQKQRRTGAGSSSGALTTLQKCRRKVTSPFPLLVELARHVPVSLPLQRAVPWPRHADLLPEHLHAPKHCPTVSNAKAQEQLCATCTARTGRTVYAQSCRNRQGHQHVLRGNRPF